MYHSRPSKNHGFTLVELLVAIGLFFLLATLVTRFLGVTIGGTKETNARAALHREAMTAMGILVADMERTTLAYFLALERTPTEPAIVGSILTDGTDESGVFTWERDMTIYQWLPQEKELQRIVAPAPSPWPADEPDFLDEQLVRDCLTSPRTNFKILSKQVADFRLAPRDGALVEISFRLEDLQSRELQLTRKVWVRNG